MPLSPIKTDSLYLIPLLFSLSFCSPESRQSGISDSAFSDAVEEFEIKVYYEAGSDPYTGNIGITSNDTWQITLESYQKLFETHTARVITVPSNLNEMEEFADQEISSWSSTKLRELGDHLAAELIDGDKITISLFFISGSYGGGEGILGLHFEGDRFAFVFKEMIESLGGSDATQKYAEQATVVHEIGHAIGLVNNGVPLSSEHEDEDHAHHTTNSEGVMYWAVESTTGILELVADFVLEGSLQLFGEQSLADARDYHP